MCRNREKVREQWKEREWERDIRRPRRDKPQQCDELFVKWLLFSSRASQLFFFFFPESDIKPGQSSIWKQFTEKVMGPHMLVR